MKKTLAPVILRIIKSRRLLIVLTAVMPFFAVSPKAYTQAVYSNGTTLKQSKPFLFEVEKNGKVSHILGTMHVGIPLSSYPDAVYRLAQSASALAFEKDVEVLRREKGDELRKMAVYPAGDSLEKNVSPQAISKLKELFDSGDGIADLMKYRPWAISQELDGELIESLMKSDVPGLWDPQHGIDNTLLRLSKEAGKKNIFLDDVSRVAQQLNEDTSAADLEKLLAYPDPRGHLLNCIRLAQRSYLSGEEAELRRYNEECENPRMLKRIEDRTMFWIPKLENSLKTGGAFVVVGAGHLDGPNGLTELLRAKGYVVRRAGPVNVTTAGARPRQSTSVK